MYEGKLVASLGAVWWGIRQLGSETLARVGFLSVVGLTVLWFLNAARRRWSSRSPGSARFALPWVTRSTRATRSGSWYMVPSVTAAAC
jgi:hypothetical protein